MLFFVSSPVSGLDYIFSTDICIDFEAELRFEAFRAKIPPCLNGRFSRDRVEYRRGRVLMSVD